MRGNTEKKKDRCSEAAKKEEIIAKIAIYDHQLVCCFTLDHAFVLFDSTQKLNGSVDTTTDPAVTA